MVSKRIIAKGRTDPRVECVCSKQLIHTSQRRSVTKLRYSLPIGLKPWLGLNSSPRYQDLPVPRLWGNAPRQESQKKIQQSRNNRESIADPNQRWGARSNDGVGAVCPVLVQPGNRWSSSLAWCTSSLVHYALSDAIMTRASELVVLVSWPQFTGVGCALCSLQFAVRRVCLVQSALHCRAIGIVGVTHTWAVFKEPK